MSKRDLQWAYNDVKFWNEQLDGFIMLRQSHAEDADTTISALVDTITDSLTIELSTALQCVKNIRRGGYYGQA